MDYINICLCTTPSHVQSKKWICSHTMEQLPHYTFEYTTAISASALSLCGLVPDNYTLCQHTCLQLT